ncbi:MAG: hypothetical protein U9R42_11460 [Bacteroidota bacterium]|nr:hypothetical protein [Bacteroidota bacterium]
MNKKTTTIIFLILSLFFNSAFGQLHIKTEIDSANITIGDWINYTLTIDHSKNIEILWPSLIDSLGSFELVELSEIDSSKKDDKRTKEQNITITNFDSGQQVIPSIIIRFRNYGDTIFQIAKTDTYIINVSTIAVDTSKSIKSIKAPLKVPIAFRELLPYLIGLIALLIIALTIYYFDRRRKNKTFLGIKLKPEIPPHLIAIRKLRELEDKKVWQKGNHKNYHFELSFIIKEYMENIYNFNATDLTTPEILNYLSKEIKEGELYKEVKGFLELSDFVKFAKVIPLPDENEKCLKVSYKFVNETKPIEEEGER